MKDIKAIIFDWGGVLIENPASGLMRYFSSYLGVDENRYTVVHRRYFRDFMRGGVSEPEFWEQVCGELGVSRPGDDYLWSRAFASVYRPRERMFELAGALKRYGYRTGLLSNTERPCVDFFRRQGYTMFTATVFSCLEGVKKPERRIYEIAVERLGCEPGEAVMVDDIKRCVEGASSAGLEAIHFKDIGQVKRELEEKGVVIKGSR